LGLSTNKFGIPAVNDIYQLSGDVQGTLMIVVTSEHSSFLVGEVTK
jgi:hypothetical protein